MEGGGERAEPLDEPWRKFPEGESKWLRPHVPLLVERMSEAVRRHVPEYGRPDDKIYGKVVEEASARAVQHFLDLIEDPSASWREVHQTYFDIGYGEALEGRGLEHLQNALRVSSRAAWRFLAGEAERIGKSLSLIALLAEANFAYLDALASAAAHGYAKATEKTAGERERRRARLLGLLLADPPAPAEVVEEQAALTGWPLPRLLTVVLLVPRGIEGPSGLPPQLLSGHDQGRPLLVVPDPDGPGRAADLAATLAGWTGAMGPSVPVTEAATSLLWARRTLDLVLSGTVSGRVTRRAGFVARAEDHLPRLLLREGGSLASLVAARRLAPLLRAGPRQAPVLAETLLECMKNGFNATGAAATLRVHPQTVRYRLARLDELFGCDLEDPEIRLEMMLLLRAWIDEFPGESS
ncbi:helix-turn-helix domain-containing protein [Actinocorallia sp. A-T 12471]|uniref:PucR family transcriptional regulator n=1 Tax=Actinocorallia sp. A-T 12471 TaxID=3089813 RepID=UPI0029D16D67|nr:helix-turn-helix domain-containing protein [Actinocorallia sp. A-T 12471]MDX6742624.1 helix-turn-helix domain-containing protein [Actinocorallia sp. A-T 12471]